MQHWDKEKCDSETHSPPLCISSPELVELFTWQEMSSKHSEVEDEVDDNIDKDDEVDQYSPSIPGPVLPCKQH